MVYYMADNMIHDMAGGHLMVECLAVLCPREPSCPRYLLALPFSYGAIASPAKVPACTLLLQL